MYLTFVTKRNLSPHGSLKARLWRFVQVKWSSLLHHLLLMTVGYPVIVVRHGQRGGVVSQDRRCYCGRMGQGKEVNIH